MPRHVDFLLIGGGLASATATETLRDAGAKGSVLILCEESVAPYNRPPLSKQALRGTLAEEKLTLLNERDRREEGIELLLACPAVALDAERRLVRTLAAGEISFGQALIATGTRAIRLQVPGAELANVHYLRTLNDARAVRASAAGAQRAVVVGASFVGLEVAATLTRMGIAVTVIEQEEVLFATLKAAKVSAAILGLFRERGVTVLLGDRVAAFSGAGRVASVTTLSGKEFACDFAVIAIGVEPNVGFLAGSGIEVEDGVLVDRFLATSRSGIYAAGDVANILDPIAGRRRRIEHWDNAVKQGRLAARNMLDQHLAYDEVSYFYVRVFDFGFEFLGAPDGTETPFERGALEERSYALIYARDDVPKALFTIGRPAVETRAIEAMIRFRVNLTTLPGDVSDPAFALEGIPNQTVLILQGGGAMGAFECGVNRALEELGIYPDIVAGVSIGAFNGAIIASHPRRASAALASFWNELAVQVPSLPRWMANDVSGNLIGAWYSYMFGSPRFFRARWLNPSPGPDTVPFTWTSFYDFAPARELIQRYVDFPGLRKSPVRLLLSAVEVETGELHIFDSYSDDITPDHVLASGSLPPAFRWTTIGKKHYWDGGIFSNSPLQQVAERSGVSGKHVIVVDLFANARALPSNMMEVLARRDEIVYAERVNRDVRSRQVIRDFQRLVGEMLDQMPPETVDLVKQWPRYIQLLGDPQPFEVTRIIREGVGGEPSSRDYDFSVAAIEANKIEGYKRTLAELSRSRRPRLRRIKGS
jgi:NTE family protein